MKLPSEQIVIESATLDDLDALDQIEQMAHISPWSKQLLGESLESEQLVTKASYEGEIKGFYVLRPLFDELELLNIVVSPQAQGLGIGRRLLGDIIRYAEYADYQRIVLEVRHSNQTARALYAGFGFTQVGQRKNYYPLPPGREDALILARDIEPAESAS